MDREFGDYLNHDLAQYHVAAVRRRRRASRRTGSTRHDAHLNPMGAKGIGEIGIVGTAAAIANAVYHATGRAVRELPMVPDRVLAALG